jgi:hypothetical protein
MNENILAIAKALYEARKIVHNANKTISNNILLDNQAKENIKIRIDTTNESIAYVQLLLNMEVLNYDA